MHPTYPLGEMYGDHAVQAPFAMVVTKTKDALGIKRAMVGGLIFADIGDNDWQRWRGTVILIPASIEATRKPCSSTINQLMTTYLGAGKDFWKPVWRLKP